MHLLDKINFVKMTGAGNDFIVIDNRTEDLSLDWSNLAPKICHRRKGVGADGLIVLERSSDVSFTMNYFNADGSYGGMCGNGGRCAALYIMQEQKIREVSFHALDYIYSANLINNELLRLRMKDPTDVRLSLSIGLGPEKIALNYIDTGSPHVVVFLDELPQKLRQAIQTQGINEIGRQIRYHPFFSPKGTNVNFVEKLDNNTISMRTYERGVEEETLACGTGSIACALISALKWKFPSPVQVKTKGGDILQVIFNRAGESIHEIILEGPAKVVFYGQYTMSD